jgi:hypothetical protein
MKTFEVVLDKTTKLVEFNGWDYESFISNTTTALIVAKDIDRCKEKVSTLYPNTEVCRITEVN